MFSRSRIILTIILILLLQVANERWKFIDNFRVQEKTIMITIAPNNNEPTPSSSQSLAEELSKPNWIVRRSGVSGQLASFKLIIGDERHIYQFQLSSLSQDYGCIFTGPILSVRIVNDHGDEIDNVPIRWKSPVGTGAFSTRLGTSLDIPLY